MDTEGLGSAFEDRNETIDMEIFCLALLLSSFFIYNSMKNLDENAVESLSLLINFAKSIESNLDGVENYTMNFPKFLWVLRDFALELVDHNGKKISATQYLENSLEINENENDNETMRKNEIRKLLKMFFKDRDCFTLVRPVMEEKKLRLIDKIPMSELRPEFLNQMEVLVNLVNNYTISYINIIITNYIIININLHFDLDFFRCKAKISTRIIHKRTNVH